MINTLTYRKGILIMKKYRIWAVVDGFSGHCEDWLKQDTKIYETTDKEAAETYAAHLNEELNKPGQFATFKYIVKLMEG
jgi:hypothetical protein